MQLLSAKKKQRGTKVCENGSIANVCVHPLLSASFPRFFSTMSAAYMLLVLIELWGKYLHNSCSMMSYQLYMSLCNRPQIPPSNKLLNMYLQCRFNVSADQITLQKVCQTILACSFWQQPSFLERIESPKH